MLLQDPHRVPHWFQKFLLQYQSAVGVFVVEDRFQGESGRQAGGSLQPPPLPPCLLQASLRCSWHRRCQC